MKRKSRRKEKRNSAKSILRLPDLEAAKSAVLIRFALNAPQGRADRRRKQRNAIPSGSPAISLRG